MFLEFLESHFQPLLTQFLFQYLELTSETLDHAGLCETSRHIRTARKGLGRFELYLWVQRGNSYCLFLTPRDWDSVAYRFPTFFRLPCQTVEAFLDVFDAFAMTPSDHSVKPKICKHKVGKKSIDASKEEAWIKIRLMHERSFSRAHPPNRNSGYAILKNPPQNTTHHKPLGINRHILR